MAILVVVHSLPRYREMDLTHCVRHLNVRIESWKQYLFTSKTRDTLHDHCLNPVSHNITLLPNHSNMNARHCSPVQDFLRVLGCRPPIFLTGELASFPGRSAMKAYSACTCPKGAINSVPIATI